MTQKTAWHMLQRIRHAAGNDGAEMLGGSVEIDEPYIGGKERNKHACKRIKRTQGHGTKTETIAFGGYGTLGQDMGPPRPEPSASLRCGRRRL